MATTNKDIGEKADGDAQPDATEFASTQDLLTDELSKFYGVELTDGDYKKFVKDCSEASVQLAFKPHDPMQQAIMDDKLGQLRRLTAEEDQPALSGEQQAIVDRLKDEEVPAAIVFDGDHWTLNAGGKEDSGNTAIGIDAIVAAAYRLTGKQG